MESKQEIFRDCILFGHPGSGKTQIAKKIVELTRNLYQHLDICDYEDHSHQKYSEGWLHNGYIWLLRKAAEIEDPLIFEISGKPHWLIPSFVKRRIELGKEVTFCYISSPLEKIFERFKKRGRGNPPSDMKRKFSQYTFEALAARVDEVCKKYSINIPKLWYDTSNLEEDNELTEKIARDLLKRLTMG